MKTIRLLSIAFVFLISCENEGRDCKDCQAALDHMSSKIKNYYCDPNFMETAWERIKNDCGAMGDTYVGYIAEKCSYGEDFTAFCGSNLYSINPLLGFDSRSLPDSINIIVQKQDVFSSSVSFGIKRTDYIEETFTGNLDDGDYLEIIVQNALTDEVLVEGSSRFTFERNNAWAQLRTTVISYSTSGGYALSFEDW